MITPALVLSLGMGLQQAPAPPASPAAPSDSGYWRTARPLPEPLLDSHAAVLNGRIYVAGGLDAHGQPTAHVYRYDPGADAWTQLKDLPAPRHNMPLVVVRDTLYAAGGLSGSSFKAEHTLWAYRPDKDEWDSRAGMPGPRGASVAVAVGGKLVVLGGYSRFKDGGLLADPVIYDPGFNSWLEVWPMPTPRDHLTAETVMGLVYVIGGRPMSPAHNYDVVEIYDPTKYLNGRWLRKAPMPTARSSLGSAVLGGKIHTFGGETAFEVFGSHEVYDPEKDLWTQAAPLPTPRHGMAVAALDEKAYVIGGGTAPGITATDVVEVYVP
ncbi:MAG TPA: kelch repeat-containing protein [Gemmatimonadales bacterium]|nr:kelch repeat-containing protein [Gemmatimonadales bacterium]